MWAASRLVARHFSVPTIAHVKKVIFAHPYAHRLDLEDLPLNEQVKFEGVATVVDWKEKALGKCSLDKVKSLAKEKNLHILQLNQKPPIVQLLNYWRPLFKAAERIAEAMRRKEGDTVKTIEIRHNILKHDLNIKMTKIHEQLQKGNKVQVEITGKEENNPDHIAQAKQVSKTVKEHFSKVPNCEVELESTDQGARILLDIPMRDDQKAEIHSLLDSPEIAKLAGFSSDDLERRKKRKEINARYDPATETIVVQEQTDLTPEMKDSLEKLEQQEEAKAEMIAFLKKKDHEKKMKKRAGSPLNISKPQAKFK